MYERKQRNSLLPEKTEAIMKKKKKYFKVAYWAAVCAFILTGCSDNHSADEKISMENVNVEPEEEKVEEPEVEESEVESGSVSTEADTEDAADSIEMEPEIVCADWSEYFNGLNGSAVIYDAADRQYTMYNSDLAETRSSPCSTFKIISSLIALVLFISIP